MPAPNSAQINAQLRECLVKQLAIRQQSEALVRLYDAASTMNNSALCDTYRQQLHDLLDLTLDTIDEVCLLTRQLIDSQEL